MGQSYYKVNGITVVSKSAESSKEHHNQQHKEKKKENDVCFKMETKKKEEKPRTVSTLWGIYNLFQEGAIKSEELTGSTLYDLFNILKQNNKEIDSSLMERYQTLQNSDGVNRFTEDSPKRTRSLNLKNYEKYNSSEKSEKK